VCLPGWVGRALHDQPVQTRSGPVERFETPGNGFATLNPPRHDRVNRPALDRLNQFRLTKETIAP